jgi:hypothetical protein
MRFSKLISAAALCGSVMALGAPSATAMPLASGAHAALTAQADGESIVPVQYRRYHRRGFGPGVGVGAAIGTAVIIGGMMAAQAEAEAARRDAVAYCMSRFRSYDPATGTYVGRDGRVRRCP